ncbi:MAG: hypothetical protein JJ916_04230 [Phycisphaerales bacterium]|nr:hypothetical protein [Phycisphaerales bacterium]
MGRKSRAFKPCSGVLPLADFPAYSMRRSAFGHGVYRVDMGRLGVLVRCPIGTNGSVLREAVRAILKYEHPSRVV